jgi:2-keto-4-pentenoate hydratase
MLTTSDLRAASDLLFEHWTQGRRLTALPEPLRPRTRAEGYAIQALLEGRSTGPLFGWKIAATSRDGQEHIGVDGPMAGRILGRRVAPSGAHLRLGVNHMRVVEPEFAFRMGRALPPRSRPYEMGEVLDAVGSIHPALEVPDSRYEDFAAVGAPQLIADNACAHWFVLGEPGQVEWRSLDLAQQSVVATIADKTVTAGRGANVLGDPRFALTWLANELSSFGVELSVGQVVTTGTCVRPLPVAPGDRVAADFGRFGSVAVVFAAEDASGSGEVAPG